MAGNLQVPKDLDDKKALRSFLVALSNNNGTGDITKNYNVYPTTSVPMDTTKYDKGLLYTELEAMFKSANGKSYTEYTINPSGQLTKVEVWEDSVKTLLLFTKDLTYNGLELSKVTITDEVESFSLTKTYTFTNGILTNKEVA